MILDYIGVKEINGSLIVIDNVENASMKKQLTFALDDGSMRQGRIANGWQTCCYPGFEGSREISLDNTRTKTTWPCNGDAAFARNARTCF